jgi:hypothetical protein
MEGADGATVSIGLSAVGTFIVVGLVDTRDVGLLRVGDGMGRGGCGIVNGTVLSIDDDVVSVRDEVDDWTWFSRLGKRSPIVDGTFVIGVVGIGNGGALLVGDDISAPSPSSSSSSLFMLSSSLMSSFILMGFDGEKVLIIGDEFGTFSFPRALIGA